VDRVRSGSDRLDSVLCGGLPANAITLVIGAPGAGKTILAYQYVFTNATRQRPALYYSTVSEAHEKLLRYGQGLSYFDTSTVGTSVFFEALGPVVRTSGLDGVVKRITDDIKTYRPGVIVIDSFRALSAYADVQTFRSFLADLADVLSAFPASAFWIGEYTASDLPNVPEFAVADAILALSRENLGLREATYLQVLKLRGSGYLSGRHACRLSSDGLDVYPRLADSGDATDYVRQTRRTSSGIAALDALLHEGFLAGSSTLVAGPSGSGKTLMGLHFIFSGAAAGEPGVIAAFQENPGQLESIASSFGWNFADPGVELLYASAVDIYVDEWIYRLLEAVERVGAKRVVIDSLGDLEAATGDAVRFREFVYSLIQRCTRAGISVMFTMELPELFRVHRLTDGAFSHLSDNVVLLQYVCEDPILKRALTVIKSRGIRHDPGIYEFDITSDGIVLGGRITSAAAVNGL
jgi:circadian clock protein KaiC